MTTQPILITARNVIKDSQNVSRSYKDGSYGPCRSLPYYYVGIRNITNRFKLAWGVFTGKYDALDWEEEK